MSFKIKSELIIVALRLYSVVFSCRLLWAIVGGVMFLLCVAIAIAALCYFCPACPIHKNMAANEAESKLG